MLDILTIGDVKWDVFLALDTADVTLEVKGTKLAIPFGKKVPVHLTHAQVAGSAPNVAVGAAKMRLSSAIVSTMGNDAAFTAAKQFLTAHKVETRFLGGKAKQTSSFSAVLNFQGESTQLAAHTSSPIVFPKNPPKAQWLHFSELGTDYTELVLHIINFALRNNVRISVNPGQIQLQERKPMLFELLAHTCALFLNLREARELIDAPHASIASVLERLTSFGPEEIVVTDGRNGAYAFDGEQFWHAPMFPGERVEATGAGDAFCAGYLGARIHHRSIPEALAWGAVNSASVVGHIGPTTGLLSHTEIRRRLKAHPSYVVHPSV